jgi:DNA-binding NarL/FixJ family response regulator
MKILLADDHRLTLEGVRKTLSEVQDMEVVGATSCGADLMHLVAETRPDVVLLDVNMPGIGGLECLERIRRHCPGVKVVVLSSFADHSHIDAALQRGATACVVKSINPRDLPAALRLACEATMFHAVAAGDASGTDARNRLDLTDREMTILEAVARGLSNKAISKELWVTEQTVKFHLNNVYRKLGVDNRTAAVRCALDNGVIELRERAAQPA